MPEGIAIHSPSNAFSQSQWYLDVLVNKEVEGAFIREGCLLEERW